MNLYLIKILKLSKLCSPKQKECVQEEYITNVKTILHRIEYRNLLTLYYPKTAWIVRGLCKIAFAQEWAGVILGNIKIRMDRTAN